MSVLQRIGVFVCHCGSNIAATVDVKKVVEVIKNEPGVVHAEDYPYMCSEAGQSLIAKAIKDQLNLDIDKKKLVLPEPIKTFGTHEVPIKLHKEVTGKLAVKVVEA